ncbi:DNA/RNA non-specific endonuclease [Arenibacter sp. GZD96]|uniref:DNA/RNA non-specific endonuclease n=1 Tax=Aurantibrevibacter litoralis TaxID=3106030 RepID=UPI002AFF111B|nr:DNA/RNA non-specific endonuclease [Arenibacter sp. GZD-96]MEA1785483.1 DNA/RNA non-specific endonuclease [Arenibacter sp. GZD-96]
MKQKYVYPVLMAFVVASFWVFDTYYAPRTKQYKTTNPSGAIAAGIWPSSTTGAIVHHAYYALSYHENFEQAEWVIYRLSKEQLTNDDRKRPYFEQDPKVITQSADWRNYKGSGYDRGHLCPAGDRRFSEDAYNETFYTSNISPQKRDFNAGIWNRLEQKVRQWGKQYVTLYVITAGILNKDLSVIGEEQVAVPDYFYKIVVRDNGDALTSIAFLLKHEENRSSLQHFVVPVDSIEQLSGIDFFKELPHELEAILESKTNMSDWPF